MTGRPFDDIRALVNDMPSPDTKMAQAVNVILSDETGLIRWDELILTLSGLLGGRVNFLKSPVL